jgi:DNA (cytosine-5)-methyltransferase 1
VKIRVLDLFSGIGGFHLGLTRAGFEVESYFSEIDKYAIDVYSNNFKDATYVGSVTDVRGADLTRIDAITFGSPCQDFSLTGKRKGLGGDRSSLIGEAIRLISECRPRFFIWENVKGTFSSNDGADFWAIIQAFTNIGGYRLEWQLLNTKWFLPQNRERIYLVGYIGDGSRGQVFPIGETAKHSWDIVSVIQINNSKESGEKQPYQQNRIYDANGISPALLRDKSDLIIKTKDFSIYDGYNNQIKDEQITGTITQHCSRDGLTNRLKVIRENKIRRLTPKECERLQGFPDNWTKFGTEGEISDSQRYKMCGNAVTVDVVKEVAKRIKLVI